ncbi:MAG TPA: hypothetical protein VMW27_14440 [Thermoanaerobaculia bacterium]|nr:hypothetical protein [Thermoanaerobaculia bacterium]
MRSKPVGAALMLLALSATVAPQSPSPIISRTELFPAEPAVNAERGFAVAQDGDWLALGARLDDDAGTDAGAVHLFQWDGVRSRWLERQKLAPSGLEPGAQFGFSLALQDGILAVGAIGQDRGDDSSLGGAVYLFTESEGVWVEQPPLTVPGVRQFGRSVAIDGGALAVGALEPRGEDELGVVFFFSSSLAPGVPLRPRDRRAAERDRFGESLALAGDLLAIGAPGDDAVGKDAGAVYVFEKAAGGDWRRTSKLLAKGSGGDSLAGDQFGSSVAASGGVVAVGAPAAGTDQTGAAYVFERSGASWRPFTLTPREPGPQARFGHAIALNGNLVAVGAPLASTGMLDRCGTVHVFQGDGVGWTEVPGPGLTADNTEARDLFGSAIAVQGDRVVAGASLGDQGGRAAGAVHSFRCDVDGCEQEAEAVASDETQGTLFGVAVDMSQDTLVVGNLRGLEGAVYVYRPAGRGWRQEAKLVSPMAESSGAFGAAVAVDHDIMVIGEPLADDEGAAVSPPVSTVVDVGRAYVYRRDRGGAWNLVTPLVLRVPLPNRRFGLSVAVHDRTIVVSSGAGGIFIAEPDGETWRQTAFFDVGEGKLALAVEPDMVAVGASFERNQEGAVHVFHRTGTGPGWVQEITTSRDPVLAGNAPGDRFGTAVTLRGDTLIAGAPGSGSDSGSVYVFKRIGASWSLEENLPSNPGDRSFGESVDLDGDALLVGSTHGADRTANRATLFLRNGSGWTREPPVEATAEPAIDPNTAVGVTIHGNFFALTAPGQDLGDRVSVFGIDPP